MKSWKARESGHASSIESHLSPRFLPAAALRCYKTHPPIAIFSQLAQIHPTSHNCYCATQRDHFLIQATSMEEGSRISGSGHRLPSAFASASVPAPFVLKTHRMVDDPSTDGVIAWGRDSNSFVVVDPFAFSQTLLPAHFKHGNFSSFVRQLNTYGFRKVDPDRWEFAHASFLRGQTHLLKQIVRKSGGCGKKKEDVESEEEEERVAAEVVRLKHEQRRIKERLEGMWKRVKETERRPRQMLAFLVKVAGDPDLVDRLGGPAIEGGEKRARRLGTATGNGRRVEMEGRDGYSWDLDGQGMGIVMGEDDDRACGVNIGGTHRGQFRGDVDDVGFFGGVEVEFGAGPAAYPYPCGPCPFHVENGVQ